MIQSTPSLISENPKPKVLAKRLSHSTNTIDDKWVATNKSKRVISSVDGLSQKEQSKMAEILVRSYISVQLTFKCRCLSNAGSKMHNSLIVVTEH